MTPPGPPRDPPGESVNRQNPNKERMIFIIYPGRFHPQNLPPRRFHARNLPAGSGENERSADFPLIICTTMNLLHSQSLFFSLKKKSPSGEFFFSAAINTFGFLFFSLQGLPEGSRPRTDPKIPFPYWKIEHLRNACPPIFCFNRRIRQNQRKSARDGQGSYPTLTER